MKFMSSEAARIQRIAIGSIQLDQFQNRMSHVQKRVQETTILEFLGNLGHAAQVFGSDAHTIRVARKNSLQK